MVTRGDESDSFPPYRLLSPACSCATSSHSICPPSLQATNRFATSLFAHVRLHGAAPSRHSYRPKSYNIRQKGRHINPDPDISRSWPTAVSTVFSVWCGAGERVTTYRKQKSTAIPSCFGTINPDDQSRAKIHSKAVLAAQLQSWK